MTYNIGDEIVVTNTPFPKSAPNGTRGKITGTWAQGSLYPIRAALDNGHSRTFASHEFEVVPTHKFAVGDRVVIQNFNPVFVGMVGTVTEFGSLWPYRILLDNEPDPFFAGLNGRLFTEAELAPEPIKVADTYPFQPGDRVVYTPPETFMGHPGHEVATPGLTGEHGTVRGADSHKATVRWDNAGLLVSAVQFLAHAAEPEPTHKHPEGLYLGEHGKRVFIEPETTAGLYRITYLDERHFRTDAPFVNHNITESLIDKVYSLIAEAPRS